MDDMARYRNDLPQLSDRLFTTDGGLETTLIFHQGIELPAFAAFDMFSRPDGLERLRTYFDAYAALAHSRRLGFILESPTWRANRDWGARIGYDGAALAASNRAAIELMVEVRDRYDGPDTPMVISGNIGPRGDGYVVDRAMSAAEAADYHGEQIHTFADTEADLVSVMTMNYVEEAIGVVRAGADAGMPVVVSFTLETDGRLPSGQALGDAIQMVDRTTAVAPAYYMINCAHPTHFERLFAREEGWTRRIKGVRANASKRSHAELDNAPDLDDGDPDELGRHFAAMRRACPGLNVVGGCCGTDIRHVQAICLACEAVRLAA
jgi:S-methylmethionine-dependent homocysteine/selenocysteine methylase